MVLVILGLVVDRDLVVPFHDTVDAEVSPSVSFSAELGPGEYLFKAGLNVEDRLIMNGSILNMKTLDVYNPSAQLGAQLEQIYVSDVQYVKVSVFDFSGETPTRAAVYSEALPAGVFLNTHSAVPCGEDLCYAVRLYDSPSGQYYIRVFRIDNLEAVSLMEEVYTSSISSMKLFGFGEDARDTLFLLVSAADGSVFLYGIDINLSAAENPVISYSVYGAGGYYIIGGALFDDGSIRRFFAALSRVDTIRFVGYDLSADDGLDFAFDRYEGWYMGGANQRGLCLMRDDGSSLRVVHFDAFDETIHDFTLSSSGYVNHVYNVASDDVCAYMTQDKMILVGLSSESYLHIENLAPGYIYPIRDIYSDASSWNNDVQARVSFFDTPPYDTIVVLDYSVGSSLDLMYADTIPLLVHVPRYISEMMVADGDLYLADHTLSVPYRIYRYDEDLNMVWAGENVGDYDWLMLPNYIYNYEEVRKLDRETGALTPYIYDLSPSDFGSILYYEENNGKLYVITGYNIYIHEIDTSDLSGSYVEPGINVAFFYDFDVDYPYVLIADLDAATGRIRLHVYDLEASSLTGPYLLDPDISGFGVIREVRIIGDTVFVGAASSDAQAMFMCDAGLSSCVRGDIDLAYGSISDFLVADDSVYVFTVADGETYIHVLDRELNFSHVSGPHHGSFNAGFPVGEYLTLITTSGGILDTLNVSFLRRNDLSVVDYADEIPFYKLQTAGLMEYGTGSYYVYLFAQDEDLLTTTVYRYNVIEATGVEEIDSPVRIRMVEGRLMIYGKGEVNLEVYTPAGRKVASFRGYVDGVREVAHLPSTGAYIVRLNGKSTKVINLMK